MKTKSFFLLLCFSVINLLTSCQSGSQSSEDIIAEVQKLGEANKVEETLPMLEKLLQHDSNNADAQYYYGTNLCRTGKLNDGIVHLSKAIELNPDYGKAYGNRGLAYYKTGEQKKALEDFNKAVVFDPENGIHYYNRGLLLNETEQLEAACADWKKAMELGYQDKNDLYELNCVK
ncbi:MAG: tetratricopeptide repeat protein [Chitinophagales bacterium]|nr:tetratricopeptide repeat protein [Bacteroidota bacterium]MCB9043157.1 tetratricopeptide repeat protein [Chitinophagales bacterium]